jgi:cobalt/nickel transport system permease protein
MHLGNGAITPECVVLTCGAASVGLAAAAVAARRAELSREKVLLAAGWGSLVFAAQAINVEIWPGISAHLVGGVLLARMLGPGLGAWTMGMVLAIQAVALGDGGIAALGANVINMALVPAGFVAGARRLTRADSSVATGLAAALAVPVAAALIVAEAALFRSGAELAGWTRFAAMMLGTHVWVGVLEGALTGVMVGIAAQVGSRDSRLAGRTSLACLASGLLVAVAMLPFSSGLPDGYEAAAQASGMAWLLGR